MKTYSWFIEANNGKKGIFTGTEDEARAWAKANLGPTFTMYRRS